MNENMGQQDGNGSTVSLPLHQTEREKRRKLITKMLFYIFIASVFRVLSSSTFLPPNSPASLISCVKNDHIAGLVHVHNTSHKKRNCERCFICHIRRNEVYSSIKTAHTEANHLRVHSTLHWKSTLRLKRPLISIFSVVSRYTYVQEGFELLTSYSENR